MPGGPPMPGGGPPGYDYSKNGNVQQANAQN